MGGFVRKGGGLGVQCCLDSVIIFIGGRSSGATSSDRNNER